MADPATMSRPPSPLSRTDSPAVGMGYFSLPFERFMREDVYHDWNSAFTLLDTMETFFDSRLDLLQRRLVKQTDKLKLRAEDVLKDFPRIKTPTTEFVPKDLDREVQRFKLRMTSRMTSLAAAWHTTKVVRTREKVTFFFGVMSLLVSALLFGMAPEWIPFAYAVQTLYLLPMRAYQYKKRAWHYFMFDLCYYSTILNLVYIYLLPQSPALWVACYCLSHGSLASAVITWRNSLVFHDADKVTSLFIHLYAPFAFTVIRHYYPGREDRFPALRHVHQLEPMRALLSSSCIYIIWQLLYWKFVMVDRRQKIESGQRTTSFSFLLNDKRGVIGRALSGIPQSYRALTFMFGQLVYGVLTELPAVFLFYDSARWSCAFLVFIFAVSVWNGGGFYIEVFGRKFEKQLEALRKELAEATAHNRSLSESLTSGRTSPTFSSDDLASLANSPELAGKDLLNSPPFPPIGVAVDAGLGTLTMPNGVGHEDKKTQ